MVAGDDEITTYREAGEQYPVTVRVLESQRRDIGMVGKLTVTSATGQPVRIDNIARLERGFGPTRITRSNRQYSINMNADTAPATRSTNRQAISAASSTRSSCRRATPSRCGARPRTSTRPRTT